MDRERFFVTVTAPSADRLRKLATKGLDLFMPTAHARGDEGVIEGLLTLDEVGELVKEGFRVSVDATMESRTGAARETTSLDAWLQAMGE